MRIFHLLIINLSFILSACALPAPNLVTSNNIVARHGMWDIICFEKDKYCAAGARYYDTRSPRQGQPEKILLQPLVFKVGNDSKPQIAFLMFLPAEVRKVHGVRISIENGFQDELHLVQCTEDRCLATILFEGSRLKQLLRSKSLIAIYQLSPLQREPIIVDTPLGDLRAAIEDADKRTIRRYGRRP